MNWELEPLHLTEDDGRIIVVRTDTEDLARYFLTVI